MVPWWLKPSGNLLVVPEEFNGDLSGVTLMRRHMRNEGDKPKSVNSL
jgi:hypothetical protein